MVSISIWPSFRFGAQSKPKADVQSRRLLIFLFIYLRFLFDIDGHWRCCIKKIQFVVVGVLWWLWLIIYEGVVLRDSTGRGVVRSVRGVAIRDCDCCFI